MNFKIINILKQKYETDALGHLYIIEPNKNNNDQYCYHWIKKSLSKILDIDELKLENKQDILFIHNLEKKQYSSDELAEIYKFTSYKSLELKRKFLIITDLSMLNILQSNKLLKTFEEPPIPLTIFLLNDHKAKALNTISSRAITLKVLANNQDHKNLLLEFFQQETDLTFEKFDKFTTENYQNIKLCIIDLIKYANSGSFQDFDSIHKTIKSLENDITYNNSSSHIKLKIFDTAMKLKIS